jgi:hypothetical protein
MTKQTVSAKALLARGALMTFLAPRLAQDAEIDLGKLLRGITDKNFSRKKATLADNIVRACDGKLAQDATLEDMTELLDALENEEVEADAAPMETKENAALPKNDREDESLDESPKYAELRKHLETSGADAEMLKACDAIMGHTARDESEEDKEGKKEGEDEDKEDDKDKETKEGKDGKMKAKDKWPPAKDKTPEKQPPGLDRKAMDSAINTAVNSERERARAVREAENYVRPTVGDIGIACDSAEDVYRAALDSMDVNHKGKHADALRDIFDAHVAARGNRTRRYAEDSAADKGSASGFASRFPEAGRIGF